MIKINSILIAGSIDATATEKIFDITQAEQLKVNGMTKYYNCKIEVENKKSKRRIKKTAK